LLRLEHLDDCETIVRIGKTESALIRSLRRDPLLHARVERLMTIPAVGPITETQKRRLWSFAETSTTMSVPRRR
jgi:hypothetical protein